MTETDQTLAKSIRRHLWGAGLFLCALLAFMIGWSAYMHISSAVIAPGSIVVESSVKTIKHKEGGIVRDIMVQDGDLVHAGDLLIRLDDAVTRANLAVVSTQLDELQATEARLTAERDNKKEITFPPALLERSVDPGVAAILDGQRFLMASRNAGMVGRIDQLNEQIKQLESQTDGLKVQTDAKNEEMQLIASELEGLESLLEDNFVSVNRVLSTKRNKTRLTGEHGSLLAETAQTGLSISERRMRILQLQEDSRAEILQELVDTRSQIARLSEQKVAAEDQLARMDITAPRSGYVHQLAVHTRGGVISPAEPIMVIVPQDDSLVIEVQVQPTDIDQLYPGQVATVRLPALNQRTTPELKAEIKTVSAETSRDEVTGMTFYTARLGLVKGEREKLGDNVLLPGMPVEALVQTSDRSILSYLVKPFKDQMTHALREE